MSPPVECSPAAVLPATAVEASKGRTERKRKILEHAISVAGKLAQWQPGTKAFNDAQAEFEQSYWMEIPLIETDPIADACTKLRRAARHDAAADINQAVIDLARVIRTEMDHTYRPVLPSPYSP